MKNPQTIAQLKKVWPGQLEVEFINRLLTGTE